MRPYGPMVTVYKAVVERTSPKLIQANTFVINKVLTD